MSGDATTGSGGGVKGTGERMGGAPDSPGIGRDAQGRAAARPGRTSRTGAGVKLSDADWRSRNSTRRVGDLPANARRILDAAAQGRAAGASLVVTPELSLCGYPPEDLVLRPAFLDACARELAALAAQVTEGVLLVGFPERHDGQRHNAMAVIRDGRVAQVYRKQCLPNYTVFDEERYFTPGNAPCVFDVDGVRVGLVICEDIWFPGPPRSAQAAGAQVLRGRRMARPITRGSRRCAASRSTRAPRETGLPIVYVNRVGGQDELVFDGASFVARRATARWRSSCRRGTRRWRSSTSTARGPRHVRGALDPRARAACLRCAGHGRARLRATRTAFPACCWGCPAASIRR